MHENKSHQRTRGLSDNGHWEQASFCPKQIKKVRNNKKVFIWSESIKKKNKFFKISNQNDDANGHSGQKN